VRKTTDRELDLAQAMHDALADVVKGYSDDETFTALYALLCDGIRTSPDPVELATSVSRLHNGCAIGRAGKRVRCAQRTHSHGDNGSSK